MRKYNCDFCGKEIKGDDNITMGFYEKDYSTIAEFDHCKECMPKLIEVLKDIKFNKE